jgi:hypothetical protein
MPHTHNDHATMFFSVSQSVVSTTERDDQITERKNLFNGSTSLRVLCKDLCSLLDPAGRSLGCLGIFFLDKVS